MACNMRAVVLNATCTRARHTRVTHNSTCLLPLDPCPTVSAGISSADCNITYVAVVKLFIHIYLDSLSLNVCNAAFCRDPRTCKRFNCISVQKEEKIKKRNVNFWANKNDVRYSSIPQFCRIGQMCNSIPGIIYLHYA